MKVYLDMDDVIAAFVESPMLHPSTLPRVYNDYSEMYEIGFFENLPVVRSSLMNVRKLVRDYNVSILSQPVANSAHSYSEKVLWIMKWFPELKDKIVLTQNKEELAKHGRVLIDDNAKKWKDKWEAEGGEFLHFNTHEPEKSWDTIFGALEALKIEFSTVKVSQ